MPQLFLDSMLEHCLELGASDLHLHPATSNYLVRIRVSGHLYPFKNISFSLGDKLISFLKFNAQMDIGEKRKPQSGQYERVLRNQKASLRVSTLPNKTGRESMVLRVYRYAEPLPFLETSLFRGTAKAIFQSCESQTGLFLFSGSTGSGKSTSMYSLVSELTHQTEKQVITIEDPVEHYHQDFLQVEVNERAGLTYGTIIRSILRHDPDVLIIGEIRDAETAQMATGSALTGHLVISTIHASSLTGIIARLEELGVSKENLRHCLLGISFQKIQALYCPLCQGTCQLYCKHLSRKRTVLYEVETEQNKLKRMLEGQKDEPILSLNKELQKGFCYGFF
ncbi:general secretion pathway protein E [Listeria fleischmannii subsp. coloradonensis]|uniref:competence type IV pilus ATPase ComGA n=1 Tax=Listeria fleischmannii TaxID=1069827 RepID=UPI000254F74D|nr:competence type IV pilus ATPase ComGA [Listeria fleischmannii]EIA20674.1 general secretion pathway protein E [Listeria fleischmannii subsp. coloradonensis]